MSSVINISDASFENDVMNSGKPVCVYFWAEWCGPCKFMSPVIEELSDDYGDSVLFAKLDVDENRVVPAKYGIRGIPTLMLFKNGALAATKVGAASKSQLTLFIDSNI